MNNKITSDKLKDLAKELDQLGLRGESSDVGKLSIKMAPVEVATMFGLNPNIMMEKSPDDNGIDIGRILKVLSKAKLVGFGGECAETAIAINRVLFYGEGIVIAIVNKHIYETTRELVGHVAVEYNGKFYDCDGQKEFERVESWAMLDENDPEYSFDTTEQAYEAVKIYPSDEELMSYFGGCNLEDKMRQLELAEMEVEKELEKE